jgi:hypothetical protein
LPSEPAEPASETSVFEAKSVTPKKDPAAPTDKFAPN